MHLTGTNIVEAVEVVVTGTIMIGIVTEVGHNSAGHRTFDCCDGGEARAGKLEMRGCRCGCEHVCVRIDRGRF